MKRNSLTVFLLCIAVISWAQTPSDVFLFDIDLDKGRITNMVNVTNRKNGYDNQPYFSSDGQRLYFTRSLSGQTDIYYYDLKLKVVREFSFSPESEYSAKPLPDGKFVSFVQVGEDSSQKLFKISLDGGGPIVVYDNPQIGYYSWMDNNNIALFELGEPNSLKHVNLLMSESKTIISNVGRSLQSFGGYLFFVHKDPGSRWWIKKYDPITGSITNVLQAIESREDFFVTSSGMILMGDGQSIFYEKKGKWRKLVDIESLDIIDFDRIAVSPDGRKLAVTSKN